MSKWDFIEYLSENDVAVIDYDEEEIKKEFNMANELIQKLKNDRYC